MISAVPPKEYGDRFLSFIRSVIRGNDPSQRVRVFFCWPYERKLIVPVTATDVRTRPGRQGQRAGDGEVQNRVTRSPAPARSPAT